MEKEYEIDYSFIYFSIEKCNDDDCYDDLEIEEKLEKAMFYLYIPDYEINHFNFSYPIKQINTLYSLQFHSKFYKINYLLFYSQNLFTRIS